MTDKDQQRDIQEALNLCASEPIHHIGSIQARGVLIAVERTDFLVRAASRNLDSMLAFTAEMAIGRPLQDLVGSEYMAWLRALGDPASWTGAKLGSLELLHEGQSCHCDTQVFLSGELLVIEIEQPQPPGVDVFQSLFIPVRDALWKLDSESSMGRYAQMTVDQVRLLTGFDRVMMYRFDTNWDGEVIAESKTRESDSYLNNRFPAADIPPKRANCIPETWCGSSPMWMPNRSHC